jgi:peptidyl-prolyl cis-trans isomerase D
MMRAFFPELKSFMLQAFRSSVAGVVAKVLFGLLIISFAVWGIGDYAFLRQGDPAALKVGDTSVTASQLSNEYRNELERLRRTFGPIDAETARQFGLMDQVVQRMVSQTLLDKAAQDLGLRLGNDALRNRLMAEPNFLTPSGEFDRLRFQQFLQQNGMTEGSFLALFRQDYTRALITEALSAGGRTPDVLADRLYRYRNEKRSGESIFVPAVSFVDVGEPEAAQLQSIYDDNRERFTAPEYRALTIVRIGPEEVQSQIQINDRQLQEEFAARLSELRVPERREVSQLLFADEAAAKAVQVKITGGTDFAEAGKEIGQAPEQQVLGKITRDDLVPELADAVFALSSGGVSAPVRSPFGWHIFRVVSIEPGKEPSFAEVKDRLAAELRQRLAGDAAYDLATKIEEAIAGGTAVAVAAEKNSVPVTKIAATDLRGQGPDGKPLPSLARAQALLSAAFETPSGRETQLVEGEGNVWYVAHVDGITPSALKPLADVREEALRLWQQEKREDLARARGEEILKEINAGKSLAVAGTPFNLKPNPVGPVARSAGFDPRAPVPPEVTSRLFQMKDGEVAVVPGRDGVYVVRLTGSVAADPAADAEGLAQLRTQLKQQIDGDVVAGYAEALRQRYGVSIDRAVVDRLM